MTTSPEIQNLHRLIASGIPQNIELAFELAKGLGLDLRDSSMGYYTLMRFRKEKPLRVEPFIELFRANYLDLSNMGLKNIPKEILLLKKLRTLKINDNQLSALPKGFEQLTNLKELIFTNNHFTEIPPILLKLPKLRRVDFSKNPIKEYPRHLFLQKWERVNLSQTPISMTQEAENHIKALLEERTLEGLEEAAFLGKALGLNFSFGQSISKYHPLIWQGQSKKSTIQNLDHSIRKRTYLNFHFPTETIPPNFTIFRNIQQLTAVRCEIKVFPKHLTDYFPDLYYIDFKNNQIEQLPDKMPPKLAYLFINHNQLKRIPKTILQSSTLTDLDIGYNPMEEWPADFSQLTNIVRLGLGDWPIEKLPADLSMLPKLKELDVSISPNKNLSEGMVQQFLEKLEKLIIPLQAQITALNLSGWPIKELPPFIFRIKKLEGLLLNDTLLQNLPIDKFKNLGNLQLDYTPLALTPQAEQLKKQKQLYHFTAKPPHKTAKARNHIPKQPNILRQLFRIIFFPLIKIYEFLYNLYVWIKNKSKPS